MLIALLRFVWIGCCAVAMVLQTLLLLHQPLDGQWWLLGFIFGATVFGYQYFMREPWKRVLAYVAGAGAFICLLELPRLTAIQVVAPSVVWVWYYFAGEQSLRRLRFLKPASIAFVWAWVTVWLPLDWHLWSSSALIFVGRGAFVFALALSYDLSDLRYDQQHQLLTLVQHLGEKRTFEWIDKALLCSGLVYVFNYLLGIYDLCAMSMLLLSLVFSAQCLRFIRKQQTWEYWQKFWIDALLIAQFLFVAVCTLAGT